MKGASVKDYAGVLTSQVAQHDSTDGSGDAPNEMLGAETTLPISDDSVFIFGKQSNNDLYLHLATRVFNDDRKGFSYPPGHELARSSRSRGMHRPANIRELGSICRFAIRRLRT